MFSRKGEKEGRALTGNRLRPNASAGAFDDTLARCKPYAAALDVFTMETFEKFEDDRRVFGLNPCPLSATEMRQSLSSRIASTQT